MRWTKEDRKSGKRLMAGTEKPVFPKAGRRIEED